MKSQTETESKTYSKRMNKCTIVIITESKTKRISNKSTQKLVRVQTTQFTIQFVCYKQFQEIQKQIFGHEKYSKIFKIIFVRS